MPGQETKIPQATKQPSPCTKTTELVVHSRAHAPQLEKTHLLITTDMGQPKTTANKQIKKPF